MAPTVKILLFGEQNVGKTSILMQYAEGKFSKWTHSTVGVDFKTKLLTYKNKPTNVLVWDNSGCTCGAQRAVDMLPTSMFREADGVIFVYDVTKQETFDRLKFWMDIANERDVNPNAIRMLIGNKIDMTPRQVTSFEGASFAEGYNMHFAECSALSRDDIEQAFGTVVTEIFKSPHFTEKFAGTEDVISLEFPKPNSAASTKTTC